MGDSVTSDPLRNRTLANILSELREFKTKKKKRGWGRKSKSKGREVKNAFLSVLDAKTKYVATGAAGL